MKDGTGTGSAGSPKAVKSKKAFVEDLEPAAASRKKMPFGLGGFFQNGKKQAPVEEEEEEEEELVSASSGIKKPFGIGNFFKK